MVVALSYSKFRVYFLDSLHVIGRAGTSAWLCAVAVFVKVLEWKQQIQKMNKSSGLALGLVIQNRKRSSVLRFRSFFD